MVSRTQCDKQKVSRLTRANTPSQCCSSFPFDLNATLCYTPIPDPMLGHNLYIDSQFPLLRGPLSIRPSFTYNRSKSSNFSLYLKIFLLILDPSVHVIKSSSP